MKIIIGKKSGFCNGVKYTIDQATKTINENENIYCLGQIVHNERVIMDLEKNGMKTIDDIEKCPNNSKLIIRAHGEKKEIFERAKEKNIEVIDLTCKRIKDIIDKIIQKKDDCFIIIMGKKNHPESLGVKSFSGNNSYIIESEDDINECIEMINKSKLNKVYIVSQTTYNSEKFDNIVNKLKIDKEIIVDKTICNATSNRQNETADLSKKVDIMIIVGGKNSSNTKELENVSKKYCKKVYLVQSYEDLKDKNIESNNTIGIMAGASTPNIVVEEIVKYLHNIKK